MQKSVFVPDDDVAFYEAVGLERLLYDEKFMFLLKLFYDIFLTSIFSLMFFKIKQHAVYQRKIPLIFLPNQC
jgi:hypothetical protein